MKVDIVEFVEKDIDTDIATGNDKTSYVSELTTTHLVKQDELV